MAPSRNSVPVLVALFFFLILVAQSTKASKELTPPCDSHIYCQGRLLHTVQMAEIFNDSKHFVDMSLKDSPQVTLDNFEQFFNRTNQNPTTEQVRTFVESNFLEPSSEFVPWDPVDWNDSPDFLKKVVDPELENWGEILNNLWKQLGRMTSLDVQNHPEKYSLLYLAHPVIVPGGRFREVYYWDSYWTMEGLLLSGMHETAKGMLQNFLEMVHKYGKVPNGGRIYYLNRSQPPYLISMVKLYVDYTKDIEFVRENIDLLEKEFQFWEDERSIPVRDKITNKVQKVSQYNVPSGGPRPESYKEDYKLAMNLSSNEEKQDLYVELKSGAESGWDYSTRWFVRDDAEKCI